jgi:NitT/TauT family transport system ATP-binding protein
MHSQPAKPLVSLREVGKTFASGTVALDGLDLSIGEGEFVSLLGPSGCGKSTALRIIAGLAEPSRGRVEHREPESSSGQVGFVFQEPTLMPWRTIAANVGLPLQLNGRHRESA